MLQTQFLDQCFKEKYQEQHHLLRHPKEFCLGSLILNF